MTRFELLKEQNDSEMLDFIVKAFTLAGYSEDEIHEYLFEEI